MAKVDHSTSFYQKMAELQEKLKRSEEERMKLEEKFTLMMKSCREEEEKRICALRERYEKFLEDDKRRRDRNERILQTLEKIENRAAALSAKSERLKLLRKHYEAYLIRMYPLWKKQSSPPTQQSVPTHYPLSLPMDAEKGLPWFGSGNGNGPYLNNMPVPSARSSLSPGSDQLWVPATSRNIPLYGNTKQSVPKTVENKDNIVETCSPAVEGALDNYLQRAAELLRVPVDELEGHSEKHDEEKSVHTEQDTSRDLLNVSLSDDSILLEKKEKTAGNAAIANSKGAKEKLIEEEIHIPEVDQLAGGDNVLSAQQIAQQATRFHKQDISNQPEFAEGSENNIEEKNICDSNQIRSQIANVNKNVCGPLSEQELLSSDETKKSGLQEEYEKPAISAQNNLEVLSDENIENISKYHNAKHIDNFQEPFPNDIQQEYIVNDASFPNVQQSTPDIHLSSDMQPPFSEIHKKSSENTEHLHYALEQEATNEQEYVENEGQSDLQQQYTNAALEEDIETQNQEDTTQLTAEQEKPVKEGYNENEPHFGGYVEAQYFGNEQNYGSQNTGDTEQYDQQQFIDNSGQQYEQYSDNIEQYEQQEQYVGDGGQVYDQQYSDPYNNEAYLENAAQFEKPQQDNEKEYVQNSGNEDQYEGQYLDTNQQYGDQQDETVEQYVAEENLNQSQDRTVEQYVAEENLNQSQQDNTVEQYVAEENLNQSQDRTVEQYVAEENLNQSQQDNTVEQYVAEENLNLSQQDKTVEQYAAEKNLNQPQTYIENVDPEYTAYPEGKPQELIENMQPALHVNTEEGDIENIHNTGVEPKVLCNQAPEESDIGKQEYIVQQEELKEATHTAQDQEEATNDNTQQEAESCVVEEGFERMGKVEDQQPFEENAAGQASVASENPDIPTVEEDSEESSTGFWNPPHHSNIPSVDELAPKTAVVMEDTSESSADSKMVPPAGMPSVPNTAQEFRSLLGTPADPAGESALSDQDEVEDQLAALMEDPTSSTPAIVENEIHPESKGKKQTEAIKKERIKGGKTVTKPVPLKTKAEKDSKSKKSAESAKPPPRTGLKKPPSLIKVLESDTESLNLNTGASSNVDSDEFDFSTE